MKCALSIKWSVLQILNAGQFFCKDLFLKASALKKVQTSTCYKCQNTNYCALPSHSTWLWLIWQDHNCHILFTLHKLTVQHSVCIPVVCPCQTKGLPVIAGRSMKMPCLCMCISPSSCSSCFGFQPMCSISETMKLGKGSLPAGFLIALETRKRIFLFLLERLHVLKSACTWAYFPQYKGIIQECTYRLVAWQCIGHISFHCSSPFSVLNYPVISQESVQIFTAKLQPTYKLKLYQNPNVLKKYIREMKNQLLCCLFTEKPATKSQLIVLSCV